MPINIHTKALDFPLDTLFLSPTTNPWQTKCLFSSSSILHELPQLLHRASSTLTTRGSSATDPTTQAASETPRTITRPSRTTSFPEREGRVLSLIVTSKKEPPSYIAALEAKQQPGLEGEATTVSYKG
ncbi:hypothetical protein FH972_013227 [Carpinus fangiana]|uniref:Uncharacterized protein n=1 Tax=Carpinus fangiana TaxID=176857 RepID=A0A5N6R7P3_9ROSI|nr:hypothetical protein FH972_013227 [Carpinus fangiana]